MYRHDPLDTDKRNQRICAAKGLDGCDGRRWWMSPRTAADYDVYYQYEAAGDIYTGKFSKVGKRALGETIEIQV